MPTLGFLRRTALALLSLSLATAALAARAPQWTFVELKAPGGDAIVATGVNDHGEVTGWYRAACAERFGCVRPFLWSNGEFRTLDTPADLPRVEVNDINARGVIVGSTEIFPREVVVWKDGAWSRPGIAGQGFDINRGGDIAGMDEQSRPFLFRDGVLFGLPTLGGSAGALALNDKALVAGFSDAPDGSRRAIIWENGVLRDLGNLGGNFNVATAINNRGVVVGIANDATRMSAAFIWDGVMRRIPGLGSGSRPSAINDHGAVVGIIDSAFGFLFEDNTVTRLDTLPAVQEKGFRLVDPLAINNRGWIVGWAWRAERDSAAFVLIPR